MHVHADLSPTQWGETLREHGLRVTAGRVAALGFIARHPHSSATEIFAALEHELPSLSQQSVHNIANDLTARGILRRIDTPDSGSARYETLRGDNHHHVQCIICQRIEDIECVIGEAPCLTPSDTHGMRLIEASVTFRGVCTNCDDTAELAGTARAMAG